MGRGSSKRNGIGGVGSGMMSAANNQNMQSANDQNSQQAQNMFSGSDDQIQQQFMSMDDAALNSLLSNLPSRSTLLSQGLNTNETQKVVAALGMHEKPTILDNATWDAEAKVNALDNVHLWRGVTGAKGISAQDVTNHLRSSDKTYIGDGIHGDGLYFTTKFSYAKSYSDGTSNSITKAFIDKRKAKVVTEKSLLKMQSQEKKSTLLNMDLSTYGLYKGYNVIRVPGGNSGASNSYSKGGQDFYVALSRSVLTIRDTSR